MRKTIAILFSLLLICSLSFVALADAAEDPVLESEEMMQTEIADPAGACDHEHGLESESLPAIPVAMTSVEEVAPTSLLAEPCDACGEGTVRKTKVERGTWRTYQYQLCEHKDIGGLADMLQRRTVTEIYECDSCDYSYEAKIGYDYAVYCQQRSHRYITTQL